MSQDYSASVHQSHSIAFDQAWNPYPTDQGWSIFQQTELPENLPDFGENVLDAFIQHDVGDAALMSPDSQMHVTSTARSPLAEQMLVSSPSQTPGSSAVPVCTSYPGEFGFAVTLEKQQKQTKSANWIYFPDLQKLFVKINKPCPFLFKSAKKPPTGSVIRALPVFLNPEHIQEVVRRCPTHRTIRDTGESPGLAQHLVVSEHQLAKHVEDGYTRRLSVIIPYEDPQAGAEWVTNLYKFMCFSSCHSGYSRRPLHVIFTLECNGLVLGRQVIKVRCCASPGRDGCQEEESLLGKKPNKRKMAPGDKTVLMSDIKRQRAGGGRDEIFTIQVRGRENYETLRQLRDSLELVEQLPPEVIAQFRWQQRELDRWCLSDDDPQNTKDKRLTLSLPTMVPAPLGTTPLAPSLSAPPSDKMKRNATASSSSSSSPTNQAVGAFDYPTSATPSFDIKHTMSLYF